MRRELKAEEEAEEREAVAAEDAPIEPRPIAPPPAPLQDGAKPEDAPGTGGTKKDEGSL
jgi:hypothetical protein